MKSNNTNNLAFRVEKNGVRTSQSSLVIERILLLMQNGHYEEADLLASAELLFSGTDAELWLVAGLARFQKGNFRTALSAFKMSAWLDDNALARAMAGELQSM